MELLQLKFLAETQYPEVMQLLQAQETPVPPSLIERLRFFFQYGSAPHGVTPLILEEDNRAYMHYQRTRLHLTYDARRDRLQREHGLWHE